MYTLGTFQSLKRDSNTFICYQSNKLSGKLQQNIADVISFPDKTTNFQNSDGLNGNKLEHRYVTANKMTASSINIVAI
jgi:hypothetical protein